MLELRAATDFSPRKSRRGDPWTEDEARAVLAAARSAPSLAAFARRHGLNDRQLYWWHKRLRAHPELASASPSFVRICTQSLTHDASARIEIAVADAVIRVAPDFDPQTLAQAVAALKSCR